ncbi:RxLR effector protein [Phytophthora megakarya]|uniref:RxLR effector protein n=1 Tax=Phytophthora megakarya TaxID=4795 RepID=A0A225VUN9_9STRA|nr:RxLR effector protein [Phytophthora megakarya]
MKFQVLLATVFAVVFCSIVVSATTEIEQAKTSALSISQSSYAAFEDQKRSLRSSKMAEVGNEKTEERGAWKWVKVRYWLEAEKSDEHVRKALKLNGMDEATMKFQKNYKYYEYFAKKSLEYRIGRWLGKDMTTWNVWKELGLHTKITKRDDIDSIAHTPEFKIYSRYVNDFDHNMIQTVKVGYNVPSLIISRGASDAEMYARVKIMAIAQRENKYAQMLLGMTDPWKRRTTLLDKKALREHDDYPWYQLFKILKKQGQAEKAAV